MRAPAGATVFMPPFQGSAVKRVALVPTTYIMGY
jgi:hypothetical protein